MPTKRARARSESSLSFRWRRIVDDNLPRALRPRRKRLMSPGETDDEDALAFEDSAQAWAYWDSVKEVEAQGAANRGTEQPVEEAGLITEEAQEPQNVTQQQGQSADTTTNMEDVKDVQDVKSTSEWKEWKGQAWLNFDLVQEPSYGIKGPDGEKALSLKEVRGKKGIIEDGIMLSFEGNMPVLEPGVYAYADFPKLLKYAEDFGGREIGVAKIVVPKKWAQHMDMPVEVKETSSLPLEIEGATHIKLSHRLDTMSKNVNIITIEGKAGAPENAQALRELIKGINGEIITGNDVSIMKSDAKYIMNISAGPEVRKALGCVDMHLKELEGNILNKSKSWDLLEPRFFISKDAGSVFPMAAEGHGAYSFTYHHAGAPKVWHVLRPTCSNQFDNFMFDHRRNRNDKAPTCGQYVRHCSIYIKEKQLAKGEVMKNMRVVQNPGELIVIFPLAYHQGYNCGPNIAETMVYGTEGWTNIFAENPQWYRDCTTNCPKPALWSPVPLDMTFVKTNKDAEEEIIETTPLVTGMRVEDLEAEAVVALRELARED